MSAQLRNIAQEIRKIVSPLRTLLDKLESPSSQWGKMMVDKRLSGEITTFEQLDLSFSEALKRGLNLTQVCSSYEKNMDRLKPDQRICE